MDFVIEGHKYIYEVQTIIQVFYPNENYTVLPEIPTSGITVLSRIRAENCYAAIFDSGKKVVEKNFEIYDNSVKEIKRLIKLSIYDCMRRFTGVSPSWGIMTGIRPAKRVHELWKKGLNDEEVNQYLTDMFLVSKPKAKLATEVAKAEAEILNRNNGKSIAFYAGIPFCPTRCLYCSFTSHPIDKYKGKVDAYLDALIKELRFCRQYAKGRYLESFYVGGGTPTALTPEQMEKLLVCINDNYDIKNIKEFTYEAGRPDTITKQKLALLKKYSVNRISINPQTMRQKTLDAIGRKHSVDEFVSAYETARDEGFENINIDLILGLPGETVDDVKYTMAEIAAFNPVSLTIHTLAVKRASGLKLTLSSQQLAKMDAMEEMLAESSNSCREMGLAPYYMYRQKNSEGNFENVGYAKKGFEGIYNVQIMGETQSIIAAGAGASTKIVAPGLNNPEEILINRVFNVKDADEYINRIDEMLERKRKGVIL